MKWHELLDREAPVFLDDGLMQKFKTGERLTEGDKEALRDFRDYLFGYFPSDRRRIKRLVLNYLYTR